MNAAVNEFIWSQFSAAIDTLENAINTCPDSLWGDRSKHHEYWYMVFHTLFWLDYYLSESHTDFRPPAPFGLEEMDPAGVLPSRVYCKEEMLTYLNYGREKARGAVAAMSDDTLKRMYDFGKVSLSIPELYLYNMRHVQHHAAQLNLILRQQANISSRWVFRGKTAL